jgi:hypothetical protein
MKVILVYCSLAGLQRQDEMIQQVIDLDFKIKVVEFRTLFLVVVLLILNLSQLQICYCYGSCLYRT